MSERIEPALTPKQWEIRAVRLPTDDAYASVYGFRVEGAEGHGLRLEVDVFNAEHPDEMASHEIPSNALPALIALANAALPDSDPRKITREKIALLRIEHISECDGDVCEYPTRELAAFADALESYLPPETP